MSYIPDPDKIPDWASNYGEIIKKQDQSMALLGTQVARQGQQIRAAGEAKSKQLKAVTDFIATVYKKAKKDSAVRQTEKEKEYFDKIASFKWDIDSQENVNKYLQYKAEKKKILKEGLDLDTLLKDTNLDEPTKDFLRNTSAKEALYAKEYFSIKSINGFDQKFTDQLEKDSTFNEAYEAAVTRGPQYANQFRENWAKDQFGTNRPSDGMLFDGTQQALGQWLKAKSTLELGKNVKYNASNEAIKWEERFIESLRGTSELKPEALSQRIAHDILSEANYQSIDGKKIEDYTYEDFKQILEGNTDVQRAASKYFERINNLGLSGEIDVGEMSSIIDAVLEDHPAGDSLRVFFDKEGFTEQRLMRSATNGANKKINIALAAAEVKAKSIGAQAIAQNQGDNYNLANIESALNQMEALGDTKSEEYQRLTAMKSSNNSEIEFQKGLKEWEIKLKRNDITHYKEEIKKIGNVKLFNLLNNRLNETTKNRDTYGYNSSWIVNHIEESLRFTNQGQNKVLGPHASTLKNHLENHFSKLFDAAVAAGSPDPQGDAVKAMELYLTEQKTKDGGILKYNESKGGYYNWKAQQDVARDIEKTNQKMDLLGKEQPTNQHLIEWDGDLAKINFDPNNPEALETILLNQEIYSKEDLHSAVASGQLTAEMVYKARKLGVPPSTLLEAQILYQVKKADELAAKGDDSLKKYLETYGIDKWQLPPGEVDFWSAISEDKETSSLVKQVGWENLSDNMRKRVILFKDLTNVKLVEYVFPGNNGNINRPGFEPIYSGEIYSAARELAILERKRKEVTEQNIKTNLKDRETLSPGEYFGTNLSEVTDEELNKKDADYTGF